MRSIVVFDMPHANLDRAHDTSADAACLDLVRGMLRDERLLRPADSPVVSVDEIVDGFDLLVEGAVDRLLPTDPRDHQIVETAATIIGRRTTDGDDGFERTTSALAKRALSQGLSVLAQMPEEERETIRTDIRDLIDDREQDVFGLLFQRGTLFTARLRFREPDRLKRATERLVNALAPRPGDEVDDLLRDIDSIHRVNARLWVHFEPIKIKTPAGEVAQVGEVHEVRSQLGLLRFLSVQSPQIYLVWLTIGLAALDFFLELGVLPALSVRNLSTTAWVAQFVARLSTGAFGAYLVALFLRFAELRGHLRSSAQANRGRRFTRPAFGAFIEWMVA